MNSAKESNVKSILVIAFVSVLLFGIFYYLITDVSSSSDLKTSAKIEDSPIVAQNFSYDVKGSSTEQSVFKDLSTQKVDVQPKMVLSGSTTTETTESTVPATGSDATIFAAFTVSSLIMFTGIYLFITQPKSLALAKFEKRIVRELD